MGRTALTAGIGFLLSATLAPPIAPARALAAGDLVIEGRAVDAATGEPAADVPFCWSPRERDPDDERPRTGRTGSDGAFRVEGLEPGPCALLFAPRGCSARVPWLQERITQVKWGTSGLVVRLRKGLVVAGRVLDGEGEPVVQVSVGIGPDRADDPFAGRGFPAYETVTDFDGTFRITGLEKRIWWLRVGKETRMDPIFESPGDRGAVCRVVRNVPSGDEAVVVRVVRGVTIRGWAVRRDGVPARRYGGRIVFYPMGEGPPVCHPSRRHRVSADAEDDGRFDSPPLEPGTRWDLYAEGFSEGTGALIEGIPAGTRNVEMCLQTGRGIEGTILDEEGNPAPAGVAVRFERRSPKRGVLLGGITLTDAKGRFRSYNLVDDTYTLRLDPEGEVFLPPDSPIRLREGASGARLSLRRAATLRGRVLDADGKPVPDPVVLAGAWRRARSGADGVFCLGGLVPGAATELVVRDPAGRESTFGPFTAPASGLELRLPAR
jgi:hypothetical protein